MDSKYQGTYFCRLPTEILKNIENVIYSYINSIHTDKSSCAFNSKTKGCLILISNQLFILRRIRGSECNTCPNECIKDVLKIEDVLKKVPKKNIGLIDSKIIYRLNKLNINFNADIRNVQNQIETQINSYRIKASELIQPKKEEKIELIELIKLVEYPEEKETDSIFFDVPKNF